jgi:hypothetical protein
MGRDYWNQEAHTLALCVYGSVNNAGRDGGEWGRGEDGGGGGDTDVSSPPKKNFGMYARTDTGIVNDARFINTRVAPVSRELVPDRRV